MQQRNIVFVAIGGVLLVIASMIGAGGSCLAGTTPSSMARAYADAATKGDLEALRRVGRPAKVDTEATVLGRAWEDKAEAALFKALSVGVQRAQEMHQQLVTEAIPAAGKAYWLEHQFGVSPRNTWVRERATATLSDEQKRFLIVQPKEPKGIQAVICDDVPVKKPPRPVSGFGNVARPGGFGFINRAAATPAPADEAEVPPEAPPPPPMCTSTVWAELVSIGGRDWERMGGRARQRIGMAPFLASVAAPKVSASTLALLLELGRKDLVGDDINLATAETLTALGNGAQFRSEHGERLLRELYIGAYAEGISNVAVQQPPPQGRLFRPGVATVSAALTSGTLTATFERTSEGWVTTGVSDIDVVSRAEALCAPPLEEPGTATREQGTGRRASQQAEPGPELGVEVQPEEAATSEGVALDARCEWKDISTTALAFSAPTVDSTDPGNVDTGWLITLVLLTAATLAGVMVLLSRGRSLDAAKIDLEDGEVLVDTLERRGRFSSGRITLTTRRVIVQRLHWWLASNQTVMLAISRIEGVNLALGMVIWWVLAGLVALPLVAPIGILLTMYALVAAGVRLQVTAQGRTYGFRLAGDASTARDAVRVSRAIMRQQLTLEHGVGGSSDLLLPDPVHGTALPGIAWLGVLACLLTSVAQRVSVGGVDLEGGIWLGLLLMAPGWVGAQAGRTGGALTGAFGALAVFAALHPMPYSGHFSIGAPAEWSLMVVVVVLWAFAGLVSHVGRSGSQTRAIATTLAGVTALALMLWVLPDVAGAPTARSLDWTGVVIRSTGLLLLAIGVGVGGAWPTLSSLPRRGRRPPGHAVGAVSTFAPSDGDGQSGQPHTSGAAHGAPTGVTMRLLGAALLACMVVVPAQAGSAAVSVGGEQRAAPRRAFSFPLAGRTVTMGTSPTAIMAAFPTATAPTEPSPADQGYSPVLVFTLGGSLTTIFRFTPDGLAFVELYSDSTEGLSEPLAAFSGFTRHLGVPKEKRESDERSIEIERTWKTPGATVTEKGHYGMESGDSTVEFAVIAARSTSAVANAKTGGGTGRGGGGTGLGIGGLGSGTGPGSGGSGNIDLGGRGKGTTKVVPGTIVYEGGLSREEIKRVISRVMSQIKYCYEKELHKDPTIEGELVMAWLISDSGDVQTASATHNTFAGGAAAPIEQCVQRIIERLKFPTPRGGGVVNVKYPFMFSDSGG